MQKVEIKKYLYGGGTLLAGISSAGFASGMIPPTFVGLSTGLILGIIAILTGLEYFDVKIWK